MPLLRLAGRIAALLVAIPAYYVAYLLLTDAVAVGGVTAVGAAALVVALGATYIALIPDGLGARTIGVSFGGLLAVAAIVVLSTPLLSLTPFVGLAVGAVGLVLLFAGASVADARAV
ncbi:hypothetical protein [Halopelagius longus]|uniref:Uncharacterized protein n=1 Tax=Halopelagius longus TaxID=1236180 RepID=A0A1H1ES68_9EURY|nr:hypothetical protein [Halopelagius longus]RDI71865.1 hypothetical protein DWB78_09085 [Halopelagius longus]SDQ91404.1 hypothetical protein SAMN05216278_3033 [Halopelagius longus]